MTARTLLTLFGVTLVISSRAASVKSPAASEIREAPQIMAPHGLGVGWLIPDMKLEPVSGKLLTTIYAPAPAAGGLSFVVAQAFSVDHWKRTALRRDLPGDWMDIPEFRLYQLVAKRRGWSWPLTIE